jgi:hypothetical protein
MKKILLFALLTLSYFVQSQDFTGFNQSNYAGVTGVFAQPASIVDSRMKFDMNLIGLNLGVYNNYIGVDRAAFKRGKNADGKTSFPAFDDTLFADHYLSEKVKNKDKSIYVTNRIMGPSFMVAINHKNAIAFTSSVRNYVNIDGVSPNLAKLAYEEFKYPS